MVGVLILIVFAVAGILVGTNIIVPYAYSEYIAVAILACLDSVFGAVTANLEKKFRTNVFLSGFFGNALIAMFLVYLGDKLNLDIYLAAVVVFGGRILNNFSTIRREVIARIDERKNRIINSIDKKKNSKTENTKKSNKKGKIEK
jgi:small basic protein